MADPNQPSDYQNQPSQSDGGILDDLKEAGLQADTFARGAANTLTFGLANPAEAAVDATFGGGGSGDWAQRYQNELNQQTQRDVYDSINRGVAKGMGEATGVGLGMLDGAAAGYGWSNGLPNMAKGELGETMSAIKSALQGNPYVKRQVAKKLAGGGYTRADFLLNDGTYLESKFGYSADLTPRQIQAQRELGPNYNVDWWLPTHVGYATGAVAGAAGLLGAASNNQIQSRVSSSPSGGQ